jgi:hypothetical protein
MEIEMELITLVNQLSEATIDFSQRDIHLGWQVHED